jgi:hypothetical protein
VEAACFGIKIFRFQHRITRWFLKDTTRGKQAKAEDKSNKFQRNRHRGFYLAKMGAPASAKIGDTPFLNSINDSAIV